MTLARLPKVLSILESEFNNDLSREQEIDRIPLPGCQVASGGFTQACMVVQDRYALRSFSSGDGMFIPILLKEIARTLDGSEPFLLT